MDNCIQFKGGDSIPCIDVNFPTFDDPYEFDTTKFRQFIREWFSNPQFIFPGDYMDQDQTEGFQLRAQQKFIPNYVNFHNNLSGCLLYHGLGSGKTCTSILVGEAFKAFKHYNVNKNNRILVVLPPAVEQQFIDELKGECITQITYGGEDVNYTRETSEKFNNSEMKEFLLNKFKEVSKKGTGGLNKRDIQTLNSALRDGIVSRELELTTIRIINMFWNIITHIKFINNLVKSKQVVEEIGEITAQLRRGGNLIIIDEVQNLISESGILYEKFIRVVNVFSRNNKFLLLSATPIYDKPFEIGLTLNLLNPRVSFPLTRKEFDEMFIAKNKSMKNKDLFYWMCNGYVSYFSGGNPEHFPFKRVIEKRYRMGNTQEKFYKLALINETKVSKRNDDNESNDFMSKVRQFCNCVFPGDYEMKGNVMTKQEGNNKRFGNHTIDTIENEYSPKLVNIAKLIRDEPGIHFVFSDLKRYGITPLAEILTKMGFSKADHNSQFRDESPRFAIWSGDVKSQDKAAFSQKMRGIIKDMKNVNGEYLKVIMGTTSIMEGVSFKNVRNVHIMNPWWNESRIQQVIARAIRFKSHDNLPYGDRFVNVYRHISVYKSFPESQYSSLMDEYKSSEKARNVNAANTMGLLSSTVDQHMLLRSWQKKLESLEFETVLKESAVDCEHNSNANYVRLEEMIKPSVEDDGKYDLYYVNPSNGKTYVKLVNGKIVNTLTDEEYRKLIKGITPSDGTEFVEAEKVFDKGYRKQSKYNPEGTVKTLFTYEPRDDGEVIKTLKTFIINEGINCNNNSGYVPHIKNDTLTKKINETISMKLFGRFLSDYIFRNTQMVPDQGRKNKTIKTFYNNVIKNNEKLSKKFLEFAKGGDEEHMKVKNELIRQYFQMKYTSEYNDEYMYISVFKPDLVTDQYQEDLMNTLLVRGIDLDEFKSNLEFIKKVYYDMVRYEIKDISNFVNYMKQFN